MYMHCASDSNRLSVYRLSLDFLELHARCKTNYLGFTSNSSRFTPHNVEK